MNVARILLQGCCKAYFHRISADSQEERNFLDFQIFMFFALIFGIAQKYDHFSAFGQTENKRNKSVHKNTFLHYLFSSAK